MKKLLLFLMVIGLFSCEEEKPDRFIGDWKYENPEAQITATFTIKKNGSTYVLENPIFNEVECDQQVFNGVKPGKYIEVFGVSNYSTAKSVSFLNVRPTNDGKILTADSVGYVIWTGPTHTTTFYFNQTITRQ